MHIPAISLTAERAAMVSEGLLELYHDDRFPILTHPENDYDPKLGLLIPNHLTRPGAFII